MKSVIILFAAALTVFAIVFFTGCEVGPSSYSVTYDGNGNGKGGLAKLFVDGKQVAKGRIDKTQPAVFSADETADVGKDDATQVADKVFNDVKDSEFTGYVNKVTISIPEK